MLLVLRERIFWTTSQPTQGAPHIRDADNIGRLLTRFIIATIPCWLIGCWNVGEQIDVGMQLSGMDALPGWRAELITGLSLTISPANLLSCFLHGLLYFIPIFVAALLVSFLWEAFFATQRKRPLDEGVVYTAWFFAMILPPTATLFQVIYGVTAAVVLGKAIFGGTGRYLVSPAILGICILYLSYSNIMERADVWIPLAGYQEPTTLELAIVEGGVPALLSVGYDWWLLFIGNQPGAFGAMSALGCLLGAVYLILTGTASWRIMAGSAIGLIATVTIVRLFAPSDSVLLATPWYWQMVLGGWAFGTVFLATDPTAAATTRSGRWVFGVLVGVITVIVRLTNPSYFEGVVFAILLASIFAPLCDFVVIERNIARRKARQERKS